MKRFLLLILFWSNVTMAQQYLRWQPTWHGKPIAVTEERGVLDEFQLKQFKWYMSGLTFWKKGQQLWVDTATVRLWEAGFPQRSFLVLPSFKQMPDSLSFFLGMDSLTHLKVKLSGDTDPTLGMYWTWQNGYIHLKMEALKRTEDQQVRTISLHLGGYRHSPCKYSIGLPISRSSKKEILLETELSHWIDSSQPFPDHWMQPGQQSVLYSRIWAHYFTVKP